MRIPTMIVPDLGVVKENIFQQNFSKPVTVYACMYICRGLKLGAAHVRHVESVGQEACIYSIPEV